MHVGARPARPAQQTHQGVGTIHNRSQELGSVLRDESAVQVEELHRNHGCNDVRPNLDLPAERHKIVVDRISYPLEFGGTHACVRSAFCT